MSEQEQQKKKKKKQQLLVLNLEAENIQEVNSVLEELQKQKQSLDIQVCPRCKSPRVKRTSSMKGDMSGHMGLLSPKFFCPECGWQERTILKISNRKDNWKDVALIAELLEIEKEQPE